MHRLYDSRCALLLQLFINNEYVNSKLGKTFPTINPATNEKIADIQEGDKVSSVGNKYLKLRKSRESKNFVSPTTVFPRIKPRSTYPSKLIDSIDLVSI